MEVHERCSVRPFFLAVSDSKIQRPPHGSPYVVFNVTSTGQAPRGFVVQPSGVWKRYSDFLVLQEELAAEDPCIALRLPGKEVFKKRFNESVIARRRILLEQGLNESLASIFSVGRPIPVAFAHFLAFELNTEVGEMEPHRSSIVSTCEPVEQMDSSTMDTKDSISSACDPIAPTESTETMGEATSASHVAAPSHSVQQEELAQAANSDLSEQQSPQQEVCVQMGESNQSEHEKSVQVWSSEATSHLESATCFLALTNTVCELRSVCQEVTPLSPRFTPWIAVAATLQICIGTQTRWLHSFHRFRKLMVASAFTAVLALARAQAKDNQQLRELLLMRAEHLETKARETGSCIFNECSSAAVAGVPPNTQRHVTKLAVAWLVQKLSRLFVACPDIPRDEQDEGRVLKPLPDGAASQQDLPGDAKDKLCQKDGEGTIEEALCTKMDNLFETRGHAEALREAGFSVDRARFLVSAPVHPPSVLWRVGRACYGLSNQAPVLNSKNERRTLLLAALKIVSDAAGPGPHDGALCHKWAAILSMHGASSIREKVEASQTFQVHTQTALASGRSEFDPSLHFMVGKFRAGICELSWIERRAAAAISGAPLPEFTWEDALACFNKAVSLRLDTKPLAVDLLEIGKCLAALRRPEAADAFRDCLNAPITQQDDEAAQEQARRRLGGQVRG